MPENIKALRGRIRSIKKTMKITRAMEMVSAAKLRKTEGVMKSSRPFIEKIQALIGRLAMSEGAQDHPLFQRSETGVPLLVLFTADRGLCGAFNANLIKAAMVELKRDPALKVYAVGRKGRDYTYKYHRSRLIGEITDFNGTLDGERSDELAQELQEGFENGVYSSIRLVYPHFVSTVSNKPTVQQYLPMEASEFLGEAEENTNRVIDYILEPSPQRVFDALLPRYLKSKIFLTLAETFTSEHASRMMAMNNATKNSKELTENLTLRMNKARQAAITTEIIEIVSGANAL